MSQQVISLVMVGSDSWRDGRTDNSGCAWYLLRTARRAGAGRPLSGQSCPESCPAPPVSVQWWSVPQSRYQHMELTIGLLSSPFLVDYSEWRCCEIITLT